MITKLENFLEEVSERTIQSNQYPVLTSSKNGLFLQDAYFNKQVASKDNKGYKIIRRGEFTYRAMSDTGEFYPNMLECVDIGIVSPAYPVFRISNDIVNPDYLKYYFKSKCFQKSITSFVQGSTRASMKFGKMKTIELDLPSKKEQSQIVKKLDIIKGQIELKTKELQQLNNLVKARFVEMFGNVVTGDYKYETRRLGDVADVGSSHRVFTSEFAQNGILFYRGTEIGELANGRRPSNPFYISEEHYKRLVSDGTKPKIGDLLMPSICNKGQVWMVDTEEPFYYKDGRVLCISADKEIYNPKYLQYFMKVKTEVEYPKIGSGSTFAEFKIFLLKNFDVLTPSRKAQDEFAAFVAQVDKSKFAVRKSLEKTQLLFNSLMQEYFG